MRHVHHEELLPELEHFVDGVKYSQPALFPKIFELDQALEAKKVRGTDERHGATEAGRVSFSIVQDLLPGGRVLGPKPPPLSDCRGQPARKYDEKDARGNAQHADHRVDGPGREDFPSAFCGLCVFRHVNVQRLLINADECVPVSAAGDVLQSSGDTDRSSNSSSFVTKILELAFVAQEDRQYLSCHVKVFQSGRQTMPDVRIRVFSVCCLGRAI